MNIRQHSLVSIHDSDTFSMKEAMPRWLDVWMIAQIVNELEVVGRAFVHPSDPVVSLLDQHRSKIPGIDSANNREDGTKESETLKDLHLFKSRQCLMCFGRERIKMWKRRTMEVARMVEWMIMFAAHLRVFIPQSPFKTRKLDRSEERRVGKEC